jgi:hypothetical protein
MKTTYLPETENELNSLIKQLIEDAWEPLHGYPGRVLWHYTTAGGLQGILESKGLRATNVYYMNDTREVAYAQDLMMQEIDKKKGVYPDPVDQFLDRVITGVGISKMVFQPHVACFCDEDAGDLLSQWRGYANMGGGYALGFRAASLASHGPGIQLRKVIYEEVFQRKLVEDTLDEFCILLSTLASSVSSSTAKLNSAIGNFSHAIAQVFHEYLHCFKHPKFDKEQEWRLVQRVVPYQTADKTLITTEHAKFREARGLLVPYVELDLAEEDPNDFKMRLPLEQINIGPTLRQDLAENSLKQILNKLDYDSAHLVKIECSDIPLAW